MQTTSLKHQSLFTNFFFITANPCIVNQPKPCGDMGQCIVNIADDRSYINYTCSCENGYPESIDSDGIKTCRPSSRKFHLNTGKALL